MKAIILARVSTKEQEEGYSIAAQRQRLVEYCARKNFDVIRTFELIESSTRGERKEFTVMLDFARAQNQTIAIVADAVDRRLDPAPQLQRRGGTVRQPGILSHLSPCHIPGQRPS